MSADLSPFSRRLVDFSTRLAKYPDKQPTMLAVKDQVLIAESISPVPFGPNKAVTNNGNLVGTFLAKYKPNLVTTVFRGLPGALEDVGIFHVNLPQGQTVFTLIDRFRKDKSFAKIPRGKFSPNHVLIPAPAGGWCPYGPPNPISSIPTPNPLGSPGAEITVIDSGYMWPPAWGVGSNPLPPHCSAVIVRQADWLKLNATGTIGQWKTGTENLPDANGDGLLDELAGHANFVAGVIAQQCELPTLWIWNHNSGFANKLPFDNFSTEAAICRSLVMSQLCRPTPVIQIGHETPVFGNVSSVVWGLAFQRIGAPLNRNLTNDVVLTAPAGNENDTVPRYPAALNATYPFVKGVASHDGAGTRSTWSNHGPWVTCSAVGEYAQSTFLNVNMPLEDDPTAPHDFTPNSWATWNGTSFAAPKVAAQVAARITGGIPAGMAWTTLAACSSSGACVANNDIGIIFPF